MQQSTGGDEPDSTSPLSGSTPTRMPGTPTLEQQQQPHGLTQPTTLPQALEHLTLLTNQQRRHEQPHRRESESGHQTPQARSRRTSFIHNDTTTTTTTTTTPSFVRDNMPTEENGVFTPMQEDRRIGGTNSSSISTSLYATYFDQQFHHQVDTTNPGSFPPEIVSLIIQHLYYSLVPPPDPFPSPDPHLELVPSRVSYLPPEFAPSKQDQARDSLKRLCCVNHVWNFESTRALWRKLSFGMPKGWERVLRVVEEYNNGFRILDLQSSATNNRNSSNSPARNFGAQTTTTTDSPGDSGWSLRTVQAMDDIPRGRTMDVSEDNKWDSMMGSHRNQSTTAEPMLLDQPDQSLRALEQTIVLNPRDSPLLFTKQISFSRFRTAGMSRSVRQGSHERFVTPTRLLTLLRGTRLGKGSLLRPSLDDQHLDTDSVFTDSATEDEDELGPRSKQRGKLEAVGFTEFMDSALTKQVLDELLLRGGYLAEYEEPDDEAEDDFTPAFLEELNETSTSTTNLVSPSPSPHSQTTSPLPPLEPFRSRHLQSSTSRSPASIRRSSLSSVTVPEEYTDEERNPRSAPEDDDDENDDEDAIMEQDEDDDDNGTEGDSTLTRGRTIRSSGRLNVPHRQPLQRRSSGSAFAAPTLTNSTETNRDESEERGRGRDGHAVTGGANVPRSRGQRFSRSLLPPPSSLLNSRSSSVPAPYFGHHPHHHHNQHYHHHHQQHQHNVPPIATTQRRMSVDTERSSSVPPSVSGRRRKPPMKVIQTLEGSTEVRAIRAMDLCGCVSKSFVSALQDVITAYKLGPPALHHASTSTTTMTSGMTAISEFDSDEDDAMTDFGGGSIAESHFPSRKLRRTFFPHMRRLGLASTLLPTNLIQSFVLAFPFLTHLDLASTLSSPTLLRYLALAGQDGPGGRQMRLKSLNLARCRLLTGESLVGLLCGDCPPFTSLAEMDEGETWGSGEIVKDMTELSLFGDGAYPSPLSTAELKLIITVSPAFTGGHLRYLDLGSTPLTDNLLLESFSLQPHLIVLGLANCRSITMKGVTQFLVDKAPGVEVLDLSNAVPGPPLAMAPSSAARRRTMTQGQPTLSIMELHNTLLKTCATVDHSSRIPEEAEVLLALRATHLRVVELDEKTLEMLQGGAGDWKPIWGKGRRGWYVDIATSSAHATSPASTLPRKLVHLTRDDPKRMALQKLYEQSGTVTSEVGWNSRKMEIVRGDGMMGKEEGLYSFHAFSV
ncbi:hypothetical protein OIO90_003203 [Microbotryomycetes sp. JL221]|nr:hypothetical protein OIO90_003203 [Microbotryomycetes sp. JL221]